jgi:hypothetical protein
MPQVQCKTEASCGELGLFRFAKTERADVALSLLSFRCRNFTQRHLALAGLHLPSYEWDRVEGERGSLLLQPWLFLISQLCHETHSRTMLLNRKMHAWEFWKTDTHRSSVPVFKLERHPFFRWMQSTFWQMKLGLGFSACPLPPPGTIILLALWTTGKKGTRGLKVMPEGTKKEKGNCDRENDGKQSIVCFCLVIF